VAGDINRGQREFASLPEVVADERHGQSLGASGLAHKLQRQQGR